MEGLNKIKIASFGHSFIQIGKLVGRRDKKSEEGQFRRRD